MFSLFLTSYSPILRVFLDACVGWLFVYTARVTWNYLHVASLLRHIPGPKAPSSLWGSEWDMHKSSPGALYLEWRQQYGGVVKVKGALGRSILAISDRRAVDYILKDHVYDFPKPQGVREWFRLLVGEGILFVEGKAAHGRQRKMFTPALTHQGIRPLLNTFYGIASKMADTLASQLDKSDTDIIEVDMQWWANRFSLDTIGLAGFSYDFNSISGDSNPLAKALEALTNTADNFSSFVMKALFFTFPGILKIPSEKGKFIHDTREELGKVATRMWNEAKAAGNIEGKTLMSLMMKADQEMGNDAMGQEEIAAQLRSLVQAGYETVGCQIAWILYEMARHPQVQERVREELTASTSDPSYDDLLERVPYFDAVMKECLRVHPPVLELTHVSSNNVIVPLSKPLPGTSEKEIMIPRGTIIQIPVPVLHTDPEVWGDDAAIFRPERWLEPETEKKGNSAPHKELYTFSTGPRLCPGRRFAEVEIKALIAILLRQFKLDLIPEKPIEPFWSFVVRSRVKGETSSSLPLRLSRIQY